MSALARTNCGFSADIMFTEFANWPDGLPPVSFALNEFTGPDPRVHARTGLPVELKTGLRGAKSEVGT